MNKSDQRKLIIHYFRTMNTFFGGTIARSMIFQGPHEIEAFDKLLDDHMIIVL